MKINYHLLNDTLVLQFDGRHEVVRKGDARFNAVVDAIKHNLLQTIPEIMKHNILVNVEGFEYDKESGVLLHNGKELPEGLKRKVVGLIDQGLPVDRFAKFVDKLNKNPSYRSRKMLYAFLEHNGHPLTEDGNFIAYRGCTADFKDRHTRKFDNRPGTVCEMPREEVDDDPNHTCSAGLHVAAYDYAYNWGEKTLIVEVDPTDVVAVPNDYNGTKMRVCRFKVLEVCKGRLEEEGGYVGQDFDEEDDFDFQFYVGEE